MLRQSFPQAVKTFLVRQAAKKAAFLMGRVKGIAGCFMQVQHHLQPALDAPVRRPGNPVKSLRAQAAFGRFQHIVIHGNPDVVQPPSGNYVNILFRNKVIQAVPGIIALGEPAAQVHAPVKTEIFHLHVHYAPSFCISIHIHSLSEKGLFYFI